MRPKSKYFLKFLVIIFILTACYGIVYADALDPYSTALNSSRSLTQHQKYAEALAAAKQAIYLNKHRYEGYYYAAYILSRHGAYDEAEAYVEQSIALAPPDQKAKPLQLKQATQNAKVAAPKIQEANEELSN